MGAVVSRDSDCFAHGVTSPLFVSTPAASIKNGLGEAVDGSVLGSRGAVVHALLAGSDETAGVVGVGSKGAADFLEDCGGEGVDPVRVLGRLARGEEVSQILPRASPLAVRRTERLQRKLPSGFPPSSVILTYSEMASTAGLRMTSLDTLGSDLEGLSRLQVSVPCPLLHLTSFLITSIPFLIQRALLIAGLWV